MTSDTTLPPIISLEQARAGDHIWCDVRYYLDGRNGLEAYLAGHIPGAIFVDMGLALAAPGSSADGRHPLPTSEHFAEALGMLGISAQDSVVAYDDLGGVMAARFVWMLRSLGQPAAVLDGGLAAWEATQPGELSTKSEKLSAVNVAVREWPVEFLADADYVATQTASSVAPVVDARDNKRYRGEEEPLDSRPGHIPGAANLPWEGNLNSDGHFLSPEQLRERWAKVGVNETSAPETIVYCGSGVSACHNLLTMEHVGLGKGRLYPGSWSQWSAHSERPAALGEENS